jgi:transposase
MDLGPKQHSPYGAHLVCRCVYQSQVLGMSYQQIAEANGNHPCADTIGRWVRNAIARGEVIPAHGRKGLIQEDTRKMDPFVKSCLETLVYEREHERLQDFAVKLSDMTGVHMSECDVGRALKEMGYSRVKLTNRAVEADAVTRQNYKDTLHQKGYCGQDMIFMDEVAVVSCSLAKNSRQSTK